MGQKKLTNEKVQKGKRRDQMVNVFWKDFVLGVTLFVKYAALYMCADSGVFFKIFFSQN